MPDPQFQLTPPFSTWGTGYQPRWSQGPFLTLDPQFTSSQLGWSVLSGNGQVINLMLNPPDLGDFSLQNALGRFSGSIGSRSTDPQAMVPSFLQSLGVTEWDQLYGLARQLGASTWTNVPGAQTNFVTGQPVTIGKRDGAGLFIPTPADGVISGVGLPLPAFSAGKRFGFSSGLDVHLYLYGDKDALGRDMKNLVSGGGVGFETKTSDGTPLKLRVGAGRDQVGGGAGFIRFQIGPDYVAPPP